MSREMHEEARRDALMRTIAAGLSITKESVIQVCREDPRVISARYEGETLIVVTKDGEESLRLPVPEK